MNFKLDRNFAKRIKSLTWSEVRVGLLKGWIEHGVAVDKALKLLESDNYTDVEAELASLDYSDLYAIEDKVNLLADSETIDNVKWAKLALAWLFENKSELNDPLLSIEELYADFDYPEEISHLVRYMPSESEPKNLIAEWISYVEDEVYSKLLFKIQSL